MSISELPPRKSPVSGAGTLGNDDGLWGLVLWNGSAWFSDWFYQRLQWSVSVKHKRLDDLQPHLPDGSWEALLDAIRAHLEQRLPLHAELQVRLPGGGVETWQVSGAVERNIGGQPVYLAGRMHALGSAPPGS
jgi:hypothetical protein